MHRRWQWRLLKTCQHLCHIQSACVDKNLFQRNFFKLQKKILRSAFNTFTLVCIIVCIIIEGVCINLMCFLSKIKREIIIRMWWLWCWWPVIRRTFFFVINFVKYERKWRFCVHLDNETCVVVEYTLIIEFTFLRIKTAA